MKKPLGPKLPVLRTKAINSRRADPQNLGGPRRRYVADMRRRWAKVSRAVWDKVAVEDAFGFGKSQRVGGLLLNTTWATLDEAGKLEAFQDWYTQLVKEEVLVGDGTDKPWLQEYTDTAYNQGLRNSGAVRAKKEADPVRDAMFPVDRGGIAGNMAAPVRTRKIRLLATRAFEQLRGVSQATGQKMNQVLALGLAQGLGPRDVARQLVKATNDIGRNRALTIARTEMAYAHSEGQLDGYEALGVEQINIYAEWLTTGDGKVCPRCSAIEGVIMTVKEARGLLPLHPNCRCAWMPANVGEEPDPKQKFGRTEAEKALKKAGVNKTVSDKTRKTDLDGTFVEPAPTPKPKPAPTPKPKPAPAPKPAPPGSAAKRKAEAAVTKKPNSYTMINTDAQKTKDWGTTFADTDATGRNFLAEEKRFLRTEMKDHADRVNTQTEDVADLRRDFIKKAETAKDAKATRKVLLETFGRTDGESGVAVDYSRMYDISQDNMLKNRAKEAEAFLGKLVHRKSPITPKLVNTPGRAHAKLPENEIHMDPSNKIGVHVHEMGHLLERNVNLKNAARAMRQELTNEDTAKALKKLVPGHADSELTLGTIGGVGRNTYYAAKTYGDHATEMISVGVESLYDDPVKFAKESPRYFDFMINALRGNYDNL